MSRRSLHKGKLSDLILGDGYLKLIFDIRAKYVSIIIWLSSKKVFFISNKEHFDSSFLI